MAAFNIDTISKNSLVLSGSNSGYNNFYINELEKLKQNEDGSVTVPEVLRGFMGCDVIK